MLKSHMSNKKGDKNLDIFGDCTIKPMQLDIPIVVVPMTNTRSPPKHYYRGEKERPGINEDRGERPEGQNSLKT